MVLTSNHPFFFPLSGVFFQVGDFGGAIADEAVDQGDVSAVVVALDAVRHGNIFGHEDVGFEAGGGGVGGEGSGGVSGGGDGEFFQAEVARHGNAGGQAAGFERAGGVEAFVLDEDAGKLAAGEHGSETFAERDGIGFGKDGVVAPHGGGASGEVRGGKISLDRGEIVAGIENASVFGTDGLGTSGGDNVGRSGCTPGG